MLYAGAEFFTDAPTACSPGAVCGTLDFTGSAPEPATIALLAAGLSCWTLARARRGRSGADPAEIARQQAVG
jgi:hypothetical protein